MKNKVLVEVIIPSIEKSYNVYIPISRKIGNIIGLLNKAIFELTNGTYVGNEKTGLYSITTGNLYPINMLLKETDIRNGSQVILF